MNEKMNVKFIYGSAFSSLRQRLIFKYSTREEVTTNVEGARSVNRAQSISAFHQPAGICFKAMLRRPYYSF